MRLAPRERNSRARRSPTSRATLSAAVATAMPSASAAPVRNWRRGRRVKESVTRRRNIKVSDQRAANSKQTFGQDTRESKAESWRSNPIRRLDNVAPRRTLRSFARRQEPARSGGHRIGRVRVANDERSLGDLGPALFEGGKLNGDVGWVGVEGNANGIAAALLANGGNVDRGGAVAADDVLAVLAVAFGATDAAGVESNAPAVGLLDDQEAERLASRLGGEEMKPAILHEADRDEDFPVDRGNRLGGGRSGGGASVNEVSGERQDHGEAGGSGGQHPAALAATLGFEKAALGLIGGGGDLRVGSGEPFTKNEDKSSAEDEHKEEDFVADDGPDDGHFPCARGNPLRFAQFVNACESKLGGDQPKDDGGDGEEAMKRNLQRSFEEEEPDGDGGGEAEQGAAPGLDAFGGKFDGTEDQGQFGAFANDHEKDKKEDTPAGGRSGTRGKVFDLLLDFFSQVARNAVHPDDHRNDEDGGEEKEEAFETVLIDLPALQGDGHGQTERGGQGDAGPDVA